MLFPHTVFYCLRRNSLDKELDIISLQKADVSLMVQMACILVLDFPAFPKYYVHSFSPIGVPS